MAQHERNSTFDYNYGLEAVQYLSWDRYITERMPYRARLNHFTVDEIKSTSFFAPK